MKLSFLIIPFLFWSNLSEPEEPQLICVKKSNSRNTCYYNFEIDRAKYHFMDIGCKYTKDKLMKKITKGTIALGKDWKVPC